MSDSSEKLPRYMQVLHDCITAEFPDAKIIAPLQVRGRPGAVGVMVTNPVIEPGKAAPENEQHVSLAFNADDLGNDDTLKSRAELIKACMRDDTRTVSLFRSYGATSRAIAKAQAEAE